MINSIFGVEGKCEEGGFAFDSSNNTRLQDIQKIAVTEGKQSTSIQVIYILCGDSEKQKVSI